MYKYIIYIHIYIYIILYWCHIAKIELFGQQHGQVKPRDWFQRQLPQLRTVQVGQLPVLLGAQALVGSSRTKLWLQDGYWMVMGFDDGMIFRRFPWDLWNQRTPASINIGTWWWHFAGMLNFMRWGATSCTEKPGQESSLKDLQGITMWHQHLAPAVKHSQWTSDTHTHIYIRSAHGQKMQIQIHLYQQYHATRWRKFQR